ncbi:flagellar export chaperone FlgN [Herbivorax sp. ANBcel31]|uniref:flagellar export chaperone FlgN n=1 Tax=Herbivorax sp. ANBcel31 TaxID=3069754 RepID=UPI0027B6E2E1|nr:flagellar export chaperone FlgN [Herbivorax sp. ANBcel31]MDQ2085088.1 flagellar export chaperone FlgN [Herbivorax sp. ANBcel31]
MDNQLKKYLRRLTEISKEKQRKVKDILYLTKAQAELIEKEGVEGLEKLLDDKQKKIEEINKNDEDFRACYKKIKQEFKIESLDNLETSNVKEAEELQKLTGEIKGILQEIGEVEKQNSEKIKDILGGLGGKIKKINQGRKANNVYSQGSDKRASSYFIDQKK